MTEATAAGTYKISLTLADAVDLSFQIEDKEMTDNLRLGMMVHM